MQFLISYKSARLQGNSLKLESRFGKAKFQISDDSEIKIRLKKISGNGKILINGKSYQIFSSQDIIVDNYVAEISRPMDGLGEILIESVAEMNNTLAIWKKFSKLASFTGLRVIKDQLLVSSNAKINNGEIVDVIETNPSNFYRRSDNGSIEFLGPCQITNLILRVNEVTFTNQNIYPARSEATTNSILSAKIMPSIIDSSLNKSLVKNNFLFNGNAVKFLKSNNQDLVVLKNNGLAVLSLGGSLKTNANYLIVVTVKRLHGNGKFQVGIGPYKLSIPNQMADVQADDSQFVERYVTANITNIYPGESYGLVFHASPGIGEVLISKIKVSETTTHESNIVLDYSSNIVNDLDFVGRDQVEISMKRFGRSYDTLKYSNTFSLIGKIACCDASSKIWFNKIKNLFPNIKNEENDDALYFSNIRRLEKDKIYNKIWLEPFLNGNDGHFEILKKSKYIFTPSVDNFLLLKDKCLDSKVIQLSRILPWCESNLPVFLQSKDYGVALHRSPELTKKILDHYNSDFPSLVLIGARGRFPNFVIPINEYYDYSKILPIILNGKFLLDFTENKNYDSAWQMLALTNNLPLITNNLFNSGNSFFIEDSEIEKLNSVVSNILSNQNTIKRNSNQNQELNNSLQSMLEFN